MTLHKHKITKPAFRRNKRFMLPTRFTRLIQTL